MLHFQLTDVRGAIMFQVDRKFAGAAVLCATFLAASPAAQAYSEDWYSRSKPLKAMEDGTAQALAYGTAYQKDGYVKNHTWYKDPRKGGSYVYTQTDYMYYKYSSTCGCPSWSQKLYSDQSERSNSGDWEDQYDHDDYTTRSHEGKVRLYYKVCEDQPWSPDACSRNPYVLFKDI